MVVIHLFWQTAAWGSSLYSVACSVCLFCDSVLFLCVSSVLYLLCTIIEDLSRDTGNLNWKQNLLKKGWGWVSFLDCLEKSECSILLWCAEGTLSWSSVPILRLRHWRRKKRFFFSLPFIIRHWLWEFPQVLLPEEWGRLEPGSYITRQCSFVWAA